jgi:hypothetical protein
MLDELLHDIMITGILAIAQYKQNNTIITHNIIPDDHPTRF